ncbi:ribosomal protein L30e Rpl30e [methanogenic archaeon ISO4-H5]|jgi:large subunit ribosomal protein L30e|nr:ribosomal protein L30e Rpl30e [methanogenic archaeon ISO4-H5]MBO5519241.1 50S ribosomal protein L30e [Methanomethylophilus sp.]MEE3363408.1 50S ribosomal protein L30e [Methanomethylophilus sp.]
MSEVDISKALKAAISTGKVEFGVDQTEKAVKNGKAQMIVLSANCPSAELVNNKDVKIHIYSGNNMELGALCGKPFSVSALAIIDKGTSNILTL